MSKQTQTVSEEQNLIRLDRFLVDCAPEVSRANLQRVIKDGEVLVNNKATTKASTTLLTNDVVQFEIPEAQQKPSAEEGTLDILYEDDDLIVINKRPGVTVHPTDRRNSGTLVNTLLYLYPEIATAVHDEGAMISHMRPGIVHRLDNETSGALIIAKNRDALMALSKQFQEHTVEKIYTALVMGAINDDVTIDKPIRRKPSNVLKMGISLREGEGKPATTHITPIEHFEFGSEKLTLIACRIETGRTHQIRVHTKFFGNPVVGDHTYTNKPAERLNTSLECPRQFLHASKISFNQPVSGERITIEAPLPDDLKTVLTKLKRT